MANPANAGKLISAAWRHAADEVRYADTAAATALRHERLAVGGPAAVREAHASLAELHRRIEKHHRNAARIHEAHARRLVSWRDCRPDDVPPLFVAAVAETAGSASALITLLDDRRNTALVTPSDQVAATAHHLEATFGEGPTRDATARCRQVTASGTDLERRWPLYGSQLRTLGVQAVTAAPLHVTQHCFGAIAVFHARPVPAPADALPLGELAEVLTRTVLLIDDPLLADGDLQSVVSQAIGMVTVQCGCSVADARALLQARAFAEGERIETIAARVTRRQLNLG